MEKRAANIHRIHSSSEDRISELPEPILHHILCYLSQTEAIRTCVLSKAWRYVGCTRPKLEFASVGRGIFDSGLDRILQVYHDRNLRLDEFNVWLSEGNAYAASLLNKWIPMIIQNMCVKSFHLTLDLRTKSEQLFFELPSLILESDHIQDLSLIGCMMNPSITQVCVYLQRLQTLRLQDVHIPEQILDNILSNCPFIEDVSLSQCKGFERINLLNNKPTNLTSFYLRGDCLFSVSRNKLLEFAHLTRLSLIRVQLSSDLFLCNLHCLEELELDRCSGIKEFKLSSRSMKRLHINNISRPFKATIDAPSIVSFLYEGILPQFISSAGAKTSDGWKSKIKLGYEHSQFFNELYGLLKALSQSEISLELNEFEICRFGSQLHIEESLLKGSTNDVGGVSLAKQLPVAVEHLTIRASDINMSSVSHFLNRLFHMFRPSFIHMGTGMMSYSRNEPRYHKIADFLFKERKTVQSYFWQRVLEGVSLQVLYRNQSEWKPAEYTGLTELSQKWRELQLRIQLKWRE